MGISLNLKEKLENMFNNLRDCLNCIPIIIATIILYGCSHSSKSNSISSDLAVEIRNNELSIKGDTTKTYTLTVAIDHDIKYEIPLKGGMQYSFLELLKKNPEYYNSIAYQLATREGHIKIGLMIPNLCDTIVNYRLNASNAYQHTCNITSGICAPLSSAFSQVNTETDIIKWLYRNGYKNVNDSLLNNIRLYIQELNRSTYKHYSSKEDIPVVASLKGINYNVSTDMQAEYYYLFACQNEREIEEFVEEVVSLKFEGATRTLSEPLLCYRSQTSIGMSCIMLIGIESNWSYQIVPVGLISIDNCSPIIENNRNAPSVSSSNNFIFKNHQILISTDSQIPNITGHLSMRFGKFQGYGYMLNVPFTFNFSGDINKIIVHRTRNQLEEIDLSDKNSPFHITLRIGLDTGDNYIPIEAIDERGNKSSYDLKITTEPINENPVIENNIYN